MLRTDGGGLDDLLDLAFGSVLESYDSAGEAGGAMRQI
jgi:hypothetical protein